MIQFYFIFLDAVNDDVKTHLKNIPKRISHTCTNTDRSTHTHTLQMRELSNIFHRDVP